MSVEWPLIFDEKDESALNNSCILNVILSQEEETPEDRESRTIEKV